MVFVSGSVEGIYEGFGGRFKALTEAFYYHYMLWFGR